MGLENSVCPTVEKKEKNIPLAGVPEFKDECAWKLMCEERHRTFRRGWENLGRDDYKCIKCSGYDNLCHDYEPMPNTNFQ